MRRALGIEPGTKVTFTAKNGVARLEVEKRHRHANVADGAGMLTAHGKAHSLLDFDAATLLKHRK